MLRRNELVLVTFFFKSEECVCGHKKLKKKKKSKHVGKCTGGEVGGFKHFVGIKITQQSFMDFL